MSAITWKGILRLRMELDGFQCLPCSETLLRDGAEQAKKKGMLAWSSRCAETYPTMRYCNAN